ncbi:MAG: tRNA-guanine transglycosylase [Promethearchaeota archaeon]
MNDSSKFKFEIKKIDAGARIGLIKFKEKSMITPNLFPVVSPFDNLISPQSIIDEFGGSAIFTNAYIIYQNKDIRELVLKKGIHNYLDFNGFIATDSGAFQHYMYGEDKELSPVEIESFQEKIGADFPVILDRPVQMNDSKEEAMNKVEDTIKRARNNIARRTTDRCAWFGPVHGGKYLDIVKHSVLEMNKLDFGFYALGGIVKTFNDYRFEISINMLLTARKFLRPDRPLHMFGLGLPQFFSLAVACGADTMDSAAYILYAKEGRYFTLQGTKHIDDLTELPCNCPVCSRFSARELKDAYHSTIIALKNKNKEKNKEKNKDKNSDKSNDKNKDNNSRALGTQNSDLSPDETDEGLPNGIELIAKHNLYVSFGELKTIRENIRQGTLWELVEQRIHSHPRLIQAYRHITKYWPQFEILEPMEKPKATFFFTELSRYRPVVYRAYKKIMDEYIIPDKSVVYLLPELDTTPINSPSFKDWIPSILRNTNHDLHLEILIISNIFGIVPYPLNEVYPFTQREWDMFYRKSNYEFNTLLEYLDLKMPELTQLWNTSNIINIDDVIVDDSKGIANNNKFNLYNIAPQFGDLTNLNVNEIYSINDVEVNRIRFIIEFLKKHNNKIEKLVILRPFEYINQNGECRKLKYHLIDDIQSILSRPNQNIIKMSKLLFLKEL